MSDDHAFPQRTATALELGADSYPRAITRWRRPKLGARPTYVIPKQATLLVDVDVDNQLADEADK